MLSQSNVDVVETLKVFRSHGVDAAFLVPTATGLRKYFMDATHVVRDRLAAWGIHSFNEQLQGEGHKKIVSTLIIGRSGVREKIDCSLYRPQSKSGDPRIWFSQLRNDARAGDLLALLRTKNGLLVINCSVVDLNGLFAKGEIRIDGLPSGLFDTAILTFVETDKSPHFNNLVEMLRDISAKGYIQTMRAGDTGVGFTLETLLGIQANSNKAPDYFGIEVKSARRHSRTTGQTQVFSQVPDWNLSRLKGSFDILHARGRFNSDKNRLQLYHEIGAVKPNSYGMQLEVNYNDDRLNQVTHVEEIKEFDVTWALSKLKERLLEKHGETVRVIADVKGSRAEESFWYSQAHYTKGPDTSALPILLETGCITVHYLIKETPPTARRPNGGAKDQGYNFKMSDKYLDALFHSVEPIQISNQELP